MAVSETLALPNQPATGAMTFVPLGGDGFTAPAAAYAVTDMELAGDASGGAMSIFVTMDDRFCSLVSFVTVNIAQASSADADLRIAVASGSGTSQIPLAIHQNLQTATALVVNTKNVGFTWNPPPVMLPGAGQAGRIIFQAKNVDANDFFLSSLIYLFDIRVRELTPMGPLLWARGAT